MVFIGKSLKIASKTPILARGILRQFLTLRQWLTQKRRVIAQQNFFHGTGIYFYSVNNNNDLHIGEAISGQTKKVVQADLSKMMIKSIKV